MEKLATVEFIKAQAKENSKKSPLDLKRGDYILAIEGGANCHNLVEWLEAKQANEPNEDDVVLCKIDSIIRFPMNYNLLGGWTARAALGKSESDTEIYETVTVVRKDTGEWVAVNSKDSNIWGNVYLPINYLDMFSKGYADALATIVRKKQIEEFNKQNVNIQLV